MFEPSNVLQSGPRFDLIQPLVTHFGTYAAPLPSSSRFEPRQRLCHPAHSHLLYVKTISTEHAPLVSHVSFPLLVYQWHVPKILKSISLMARIVKPFQWLRPPCSSLIQAHSNSNCKSQVPDSLFCFSLWATHTSALTTLPFYPSLRILCKVLLLQILLNSMPAFWYSQDVHQGPRF